MDPQPPVNPYAAPKDLSGITPSSGAANYEVRGKNLIITSGSILPLRCIKTNEVIEPGVSRRQKKIKLTWVNPWWCLLIIIPYGILILIIIAIVKTARGSITVSLSKRAIRRKRLTILTCLALTAGFLILGIMTIPTHPGIGASALAVSLLTLIITLFSLRYLTTVRHKDGWFSVKGFHPDFLRDLESENLP